MGSGGLEVEATLLQGVEGASGLNDDLDTLFAKTLCGPRDHELQINRAGSVNRTGVHVTMTIVNAISAGPWTQLLPGHLGGVTASDNLAEKLGTGARAC